MDNKELTNEDLEYAEDVKDINKICDIIARLPEDIDLDILESCIDVLKSAIKETKAAGIPEKYITRLINMEKDYILKLEKRKNKEIEWKNFCEKELKRFKKEVRTMSKEELNKIHLEIEKELKNVTANDEKILLIQKLFIIENNL